ncbi:MAG: alpha/beta hydrolase [Lapillicoccus sp.]
MTTYVLVPGAWLGAYAWERVSSTLLDAGHDVRPVTLAGLGNRSDESGVTLQTHVDDITGLVEQADLRDVVLVGHSYSGVPVGLAALALGDRVRHLVLVDANVPVEGRAFAAGEFGDRLRAELEANGGLWPPMTHDDFEGQDLAHEDIHFFEDWSKPHPGATLTDVVHLEGDLGAGLAAVPTTYVKCLLDGPDPADEVRELLASPQWSLVELETGHWPMWSAPADLSRVLLDIG